MSEKYQIAILLALTDYPDIIEEFDNEIDCKKRLRQLEKQNPRENYAWRKAE